MDKQIANPDGTDSSQICDRHSQWNKIQTRKRTQRRTTNAIFPSAPESGYHSGYITPASAPPIESKRDILGVCVGIGWGQGPEYNRRILSTYVSAANASFLLILDPGIKTLVSSGRRIESGQLGGGDAWASGGPICNRGILSTRTCSPNDASSLFLIDAGIKPGTRTPTAVPAVRDNMGRKGAWASVGCQIITGVIVPTYPQAFR